jgi:4,5-dihydroxyphthalate decarboxylase
MAHDIPLTLACWDYDRTRAMADGFRPDEVDLTYLNVRVEQTFFRMLRHREFEAYRLFPSGRADE